MPEVKIGQHWKDNDPRNFDRTLEIVSVDSRFAHCKNTRTGRVTRISLQRFKPTRTGYVLIKDIQESPNA